RKVEGLGHGIQAGAWRCAVAAELIHHVNVQGPEACEIVVVLPIAIPAVEVRCDNAVSHCPVAEDREVEPRTVPGDKPVGPGCGDAWVLAAPRPAPFYEREELFDVAPF